MTLRLQTVFSWAVSLLCLVLLLFWLKMDFDDLAFLVLGTKHPWIGNYICGDTLLISLDCLFYFTLSIFKSTPKRCLSNIFPPGTKKINPRTKLLHSLLHQKLFKNICWFINIPFSKGLKVAVKLFHCVNIKRENRSHTVNRGIKNTLVNIYLQKWNKEEILNSEFNNDFW